MQVFPLPAKFLAALMPQLQAAVLGALPQTHTITHTAAGASGTISTNTTTPHPPATLEQQQQQVHHVEQQDQKEGFEAEQGPAPRGPRHDGVSGGGGGGGAAVAGVAGAPPLSGPEAVSLLLSVVALRLRPPAEWVDDALEGGCGLRDGRVGVGHRMEGGCGLTAPAGLECGRRLRNA